MGNGCPSLRHLDDDTASQTGPSERRYLERYVVRRQYLVLRLSVVAYGVELESPGACIQ